MFRQCLYDEFRVLHLFLCCFDQLHRRNFDVSGSLNEALNETGIAGKGLVVRGSEGQHIACTVFSFCFLSP